MTERARPKLLLDEMLGGAIAEQLRARGIDATAVVADPLLIATPDEELLGCAANQQRILVTANISDFIGIAARWRNEGRTHHGLICLHHRTFPQNRSLIGAVASALAALHESRMLPAPGTEIYLSGRES
ncbi:MAG: DUF5615 family PIN-like protein [Actinomycetia bacterium]|nr:DUF5615 family PIN-like protein [Actinomycetes bacterium]